jgi:predicted helicase
MDKRVADTYAKDSKATNKNALSDPYVKAIRWASDRIGDEGIVAFITNNSFIDRIAFDGMRKHLAQDFSSIYILDLKGNIRKDSMRDGIPLGEKHTVFGLAAMVGISISFFVRSSKCSEQKILYSSVDWQATRQEKFDIIEKAQIAENLLWTEITPDKNHIWLTAGLDNAFGTFLPMGSKKGKTGREDVIFKIYGRGVATSRDAWAYHFRTDELARNIVRMIEIYNDHVARWGRLTTKPNVDDFVNNDERKISWSRDLKLDLKRGHFAEFNEDRIRQSLYRPFVKQHLFFDRILNEEVYQMPAIFPNSNTEKENRIICVSGIGSTKPFQILMTCNIPSLDFLEKTQCFPFYTYNEDGTNRRENITDGALAQFREHYGDAAITKWDIFHYIYALLHHPAYRETYAANLRRELPRIPFATDFHDFAKEGAKLADIHIHYEVQPEYPLRWIENPDALMTYRVEKMRLTKDKTAIIVNDFLTLSGIPPAAFEYRLGNRSALEWLIDQYQDRTDPRSGIVNDPNRPDDPQYIIHLIGKIVTVSLETVIICQRFENPF